MKINSIYINAFGALKNFSLDFSDGLQIIYGQNEAGKTTICEFIKSMFYGTGKRAAGQIMSIREKYTPWDGTPAGGRIYFEHSGREFCIERLFRKSDATDKVTITDIATGKSEACPSDIGKTLFGISVGAFERSVFIGNMPSISADTASGSEINQKLSNAVSTGEDDVSFASVLKRIDDARYKLISKSGRTGSQIADMEKYNSLIEKLGETDAAARKKQEIIKAINNADERLKAVNLECEKADLVLSKARDIENAQKLREYLELKGELDKLTAELTLPDGTVADEMFLKKFEFGFSKIQNMRDKVENEQAELSSLKAAARARADSSPDSIREKIEGARAKKADAEKEKCRRQEKLIELEAQAKELKEKSESAQGAKKPLNPMLLAVGIIVTLCGATLFALPKLFLPAIILSVLGFLCVLLSFVFRPEDKKKIAALRRDYDDTISAINGTKTEVLVINSEINNLDAKTENLQTALNFGVEDNRRIEESEKRIADGLAAIDLEQNKVLSFFGLPENTDINDLKKQSEMLASKAESQKQIKLRISYLSRDLANISYDEAKEKLSSLGEVLDVDIDKQKETAQRLLEEKAEIKEQKARLQTELKTAFKNIADPEDLRREIELYKEKINAKQEYFDAASIAREVLEESFVTARKRFGGTLEKEMLKIFGDLTDGEYHLVTVSDEFDISAEKSSVFGTHELEYLSRGTKDQAYLALRLAISKLITEKEALPIVLDDALSQYDDKRFLNALKFLKQYSNNAQVLLFTCHNYVSEEARQSSINVIRL